MMIMSTWAAIIFIIAWKVLCTSCVATKNCWEFKTVGFISPEHDLHLQEGTSLILNCTLKEKQNLKSQDLIWKSQTGLDLSPFVQVISNATAQLVIRNVSTEHTGMYSCRLRNTNSQSQPINVCDIQVQVGYPPPENAKIDCVAHNWTKMECSWKQRINHISTIWNFYYFKNYGPIACMPNNTHRDLCVVEDKTLQAANCMKVRLTGSNKFKENVTTNYLFIYDSRVILERPRITVNERTAQSAIIQWKFFSPLPIAGLRCQIQYNCSWRTDFCKNKLIERQFKSEKPIECKFGRCGKDGDTWCHDAYKVQNLSIPDTSNKNEKLNGLIPLTDYTVSIRCQMMPTLIKERWSEKGIATFRTSAQVPGVVPQNIVEDIQEFKGNSNFTLVLYWEDIPNISRYGNNFTYNITNGTNYWLEEQPVVFIRNYGVNYSSNFEIRSCNEMNCTEPHQIVVPKVNQANQLLQMYAVQETYPNSTYEVAWRTNESYKNLQRFIVLICSVKSRSSTAAAVGNDSCKSPVLKTVDSSGNMHSLTLDLPTLKDGFNYKFAVAIRNETFSSGLTWQVCLKHTNIYEQDIGVPIVKEGSTWVEISWDVSNYCVTKYVLGFIISYEGDDGSRGVLQIQNPFVTSENLTGLNPKTHYEGLLTVNSTKKNSTKLFKFETKEGDPLPSTDFIVAISIFLSVIIFALLAILAACLFKRIKTKIKELRNIQLPSGLREGSILQYNQSSISSPHSIDTVSGKFHLPLMTEISSSPPTSEKLMNGSHSSGFGSDFPGSTASSPTISYTFTHLSSGEPVSDPDTPCILTADSVFDYPIPDNVRYSQVGKNTMPKENQILNPMTLKVTKDTDLVDDKPTYSYAKLGIVPILPEENLEEISINESNIEQDHFSLDKLDIADDAIPISKGYTTVATASELLSQPYVKLALESSSPESNSLQSRNESPDSFLPAFSDPPTNDETDLRNTDNQDMYVPIKRLSRAYVSCSFLSDTSDRAC